ncbi:MAG: flagellar biosynthesis protein FlhB [Actinomycetota bacterium]|nr:flagellar biosynthesis protein FlhB [Actinomycetota bacterium]
MADPSKTERATPRRRQETRQKGQVSKSNEINSAVIILAVFFALRLSGQSIIYEIEALFTSIYSNLGSTSLTPESLSAIFASVLMVMVRILAPIFLVVVVVSFIASIGQVGFLLSLESLKPSLNKINPISGAKNLFSPRSLMELVKSMIKLLIFGYIGYSVTMKNLPMIIQLIDMDLGQILVTMAEVAYEIGVKIGVALFVLAAFDYAYQRYEHEKSMKMSKQEIKDEIKQAEGDPKIKGKIKRKQLQMAISRMIQEVPKADVIITNPIHLAVALRYEPDSMAAPRVVAKGARLMAERIKEIASIHNIPIIEDRLLAQSLYKTCEPGEEIPASLFKAVAEILAYVYQISRKKAM